VLQQQARVDDFIEQYNRERPHQALEMKVPADLYRPSPRPYGGLEELEYPFHDWSVVMTHCGRICFRGRKINLSHVFAGQKVAVKQVEDRIWLVRSCTTTWDISMMRRAGWNRSRIRLGRRCYPCPRNKPSPMYPE